MIEKLIWPFQIKVKYIIQMMILLSIFTKKIYYNLQLLGSLKKKNYDILV